MRKTMCGLVAVAVVALGAVLMAGCESGDKMEPTTQSAMVAPGALSLCAGCGEIKGTSKCCDAGAMSCSGCGLSKGSPGCCRMDKGSTDVALCATCGHIKGDEMCCKPGQDRCACGMVKGSAGCCKIPADMKSN